jgi:hypothetical protein
VKNAIVNRENDSWRNGLIGAVDINFKQGGPASGH